MSALAAALAEIVGARHVLTGEAAQPFLVDWLGKYRGAATAVVRPASTEEVSRVVAACAAARAPIVPQGGRTSLSGGATPDASGRAVALSLARLNRIRAVDPVGDTMTVEAGVVLAAAQQAARDAGRFFPMSLGAEGSCTIGGNLAANAGGVAVLRYGVMRELTLGLEVVLPDGRVWDGLRALRKDNSGYALRDLFIGSEGTLGVVTAAVLRLFPQPRARVTAFVALPGLEAALALLQIVRGACADRVTAFEFLTRETVALILRHTPGLRAPFADIPAASVLVELSDVDDEAALRARLETALARALEQGVARDAVVAADLAQAKAFWRLRESVSEALLREGKAAKHDVSTPVAQMARFVAAADAAVARVAPGARPIVFGHLGDGNLHYNVLAPPGGEEDFAAQAPALTRAVHEETLRLRGSISAEHGVGQLRAGEMTLCKSPLDLELMRAIKQAFDPLGLMNPGKLLP